MIQITSLNAHRKAATQYVFFTARKLEGHGVDEYHFMTVAKKMNAVAWFVRDTSNSFYHAKNKAAMLGLVKLITKKFNGRTVFVGSSMGAYGAMLFATSCMPEKVIAFSPSPPPMSKLHKTYSGIETDIHVCKNSEWNKVNGKTDPQNAMMFSENCNIIWHDCNIHNVAAFIREEKSLEGIIRNA